VKTGWKKCFQYLPAILNLEGVYPTLKKAEYFIEDS
jgi:hypothetical protein